MIVYFYVIQILSLQIHRDVRLHTSTLCCRNRTKNKLHSVLQMVFVTVSTSVCGIARDGFQGNTTHILLRSFPFWERSFIMAQSQHGIWEAFTPTHSSVHQTQYVQCSPLWDSVREAGLMYTLTILSTFIHLKVLSFYGQGVPTPSRKI